MQRAARRPAENYRPVMASLIAIGDIIYSAFAKPARRAGIERSLGQEEDAGGVGVEEGAARWKEEAGKGRGSN